MFSNSMGFCIEHGLVAGNIYKKRKGTKSRRVCPNCGLALLTLQESVELDAAIKAGKTTKERIIAILRGD